MSLNEFESPLQGEGSENQGNPTCNQTINPLGVAMGFPNASMLSMVPTLKGQNASEFFKCLEKVGKLAGWSTEQLLDISEIKIEGPAKTFLEASRKTNANLDFDKFKKLIISHFVDKKSFDIDFDRLSSAQQYEHESVRDFSVRLQSLVNKSFSDDTEESDVLGKFRTKILLSKFMSGLKPSLRAPLVVHNPSTFMEAVEVASRVEKSLNLLNPNINVMTTNPQNSELDKIKKDQSDCVAKMNLMMEQMAILSDQLSKLQNKSNSNFQPHANPPRRRRVICYYCNIPGHIEPECRKKQRESRRGRQQTAVNRANPHTERR
ncbi:unnamed protein product, partial [Larinioides sclopetarius]